MSDLKPAGIPVILDGTERRFLFTLNAIDEIQSHYDMNMMEAMSKLFDEREQFQTLRYFTQVLLNDETERTKWKNPEAELKSYSDKELGWLISRDNDAEIKAAILAAYRISIPEPEDNDPNQIGGQQSS